MNARPAPRHPTAITVHQRSRLLEVGFDDGKTFRIPFELMRVYSPSAEVQGHGPGQRTIVGGKLAVGIGAVEPVGHYAVRLIFDDGHDTGIFSWDYLRELGVEQDRRWADYLAALSARGLKR